MIQAEAIPCTRLRISGLAYINDTSEAKNAYPTYWGPFSVIGEGAAR
jgi:hypothetical protein